MITFSDISEYSGTENNQKLLQQIMDLNISDKLKELLNYSLAQNPQERFSFEQLQNFSL